MLEVLNSEAPNVIQRKTQDKAMKTMEIYALIKMFHHDLCRQFCIYDFM